MNCLVGFLANIHLKEDNAQIDFFKQLSLEYGKVQLKAKKAIAAHSAVSISDENFYLT